MKKITILFTTLFIIVSFASTFAGDCWDKDETAEIEGFSEVDEKVILSFKDALECKVIDNADINLGGKDYKTDSNGNLNFPLELFEDVEDKEIPMEVKKKGYITLKTSLKIQAGSVWNKRFLLSPEMNIDNVRFVLQWDRKPKDLDLHLVCKDFHISFRDMKYVPNKARLDRDDTNGIGPETITLEKIDKNTKYSLYIHNYSGEEEINKAILYCYANNKLINIIKIINTDKSMVKVLEIIENNINQINKTVDKME